MRQYLLVARLYVTWLRRAGLPEIPDVFQGIKLPTEAELKPKINRKPFKDNDLSLLLMHVKGKELQVLMIIAMYTGARTSRDS